MLTLHVQSVKLALWSQLTSKHVNSFVGFKKFSLLITSHEMDKGDFSGLDSDLMSRKYIF